MRLALRGDTSRDIDPSIRFHAHHRAFIWANTGALDVAAHAYTQVAALRTRRGLQRREVIIVQQGLQLFQPGLVIAAIVSGRSSVLIYQANIPRELVGLNKVARAHLEAVQVKFARDAIHDAFHHKHRVWSACSAIRADRHFIGIEDSKFAVVVLQTVRAGQGTRGDDGHDNAIGGVGPRIVQEPVPHGKQDARIVKGILHLVKLAAFLVGRNEMLASILDPFDRPAQAHCGKRSQHLFCIEHHDLGAEAASDIGRDDAHLVFGQVKDGRQAVADGNRPLRRNPAREHTVVRVPTRQYAATFHRHGRAPVHKQSLMDDMRCTRKDAIGVANALHEVRGHVVWHIRVHKRRVFRR